MKKCFKHNDFFHHYILFTAILLHSSMSHVAEYLVLSKLNFTEFLNSSAFSFK